MMPCSGCVYLMVVIAVRNLERTFSWKFLGGNVASLEEGHIHKLSVLGRRTENLALQHKAKNQGMDITKFFTTWQYLFRNPENMSNMKNCHIINFPLLV